MAEFINVRTVDGPMQCAVARPDGTPRGGIVIIQEAFGLTDHIVSVVDRMAGDGWLAVAPALYHRSRNATFDYEDLPPALEMMGTLNPTDMQVDVDAAFTVLEEAGFSEAQCGIVGFCMGGAISLRASTLRELGASVTYYGGGVTFGRFGLPALVDLAPDLKSPWLGLYGDLDHSIPVEGVEQLRARATTAQVPTELIRYADAGHGFNCDDRPDHYNAEASKDAWARMQAWFDQHIEVA
ncbi:dienelactone hydrolase family protein [Nocardia sp. NPDC049220]|uniref:dienelactone hydrolase family protein n=1 Tax=Nocardia sp. NPDC049220 TaxID=3155273 RepID=UPI0033F33BB9